MKQLNLETQDCSKEQAFKGRGVWLFFQAVGSAKGRGPPFLGMTGVPGAGTRLVPGLPLAHRPRVSEE